MMDEFTQEQIDILESEYYYQCQLSMAEYIRNES